MYSEKIIIHGLVVKTLLGAYPKEREQMQDVVLDIELVVDVQEAVTRDNVEAALDYSVLEKDLRDFAAAAHFHLIESLATGIADYIVRHFPQQGVLVRLTKPKALKHAKGVSIEVTRGSLRAKG